jgi:hypothetical protein
MVLDMENKTPDSSRKIRKSMCQVCRQEEEGSIIIRWFDPDEEGHGVYTRGHLRRKERVIKIKIKMVIVEADVYHLQSVKPFSL